MFTLFVRGGAAIADLFQVDHQSSSHLNDLLFFLTDQSTEVDMCLYNGQFRKRTCIKDILKNVYKDETGKVLHS